MSTAQPVIRRWFVPDQRAESRVVCTGEVRLFLPDAGNSSTSATLVDVSPSGFRAVHGQVTLAAGDEVGFEHELFRGRARVMWSRVAEGSVQSGFLVLS